MKVEEILYVPAAFRRQRVVVVGDTMIDKSITSVRSYHHQSEDIIVIATYVETSSPGGAANVAANVSSLGGGAVHLGVVGDDGDATELRTALQRSVVRHALVVDPSRPTTRKLRIYQKGRPVLRVDTESTEPIGDRVACTLLAQCFSALDDASALIVSDYGKGVVTASLARSLVARARSLGIPTVVDSKSSDIGHFKGCATFKANRHELEAVVGRELSSERERVAAARSVSRTLGGATVVVTDAERGILSIDSDGNCHRTTPPRGRAVKSIIGACDTVAASLALASAVGMDMADVVDLASRAAAEAVAHTHTTSARGHIRA